MDLRMAWKCGVHDLLEDFVGHRPGELGRIVDVLRIVVSILESGLGLGTYLKSANKWRNWG